MKYLPILLLSILIIFIRLLGSETIFFEEGSTTVLGLGFLILSGYLIGNMVKPYNLPKITGYIISGIIFGPYLFGILSSSTTEGLKFINILALNIIAFTAGGELSLSKLRKKKRTISLLILFRFFLVFLAILGLTFLVWPWLPFFQDKSFSTIFGIGILFAIIQVAISPATTIAVITETEAKGLVTDLVLSVTVAVDVLVIIGFAAVIFLANILINPTVNFEIRYLYTVSWEIFGAMLIGVIIGAGVILYIRYIKRELVLFLMGLAFIIAKIGHLTHTDMILICLTSGFVVENFSKVGESFIHAIEKGSLLIYIIFFVIAGATLNFGALAKSWQLALLIVLVRILATYLSSYLGATISNENEMVRKYSWTGFLSQAGVSLGFAFLIQKKIPGEIGDFILSIVFASIAINQIFGPIIFRWGLSRVGEIKAR